MADPQLFGSVVDFLILVLPVLLPIGLLVLLVDTYISANKKAFLASQENELIEVLPPQDVTKSPAAMELFLTALHQTGGEATWYDKYVKGQTRSWFSLELVSRGGDVHFYIWTRKKHRKLLESQLYAQFPGIEIHDAEDYSLPWDYDGGETVEMFGLEYKLTQPDPYPIKTYVDYGLDREQEEEYKIDPITPTLEFLGSLSPGEEAWIQIIVRAHKKEDKDPEKWFGKRDNWKESAKDEIKKIREESLIDTKEPDGKSQKIQTTKGQELRIAALERSVSKLSFDTGIRAIYIADKEVYAGGNIGALIGAFKQFGSLELNSFAPTRTTSFSYPWEDPSGRKTRLLKEEMLDAYKDRAYFFRSYREYYWWRPSALKDRPHFVLNTEELATIYHFPGRVAQTPSVVRVSSKKSTPPPNLPV